MTALEIYYSNPMVDGPDTGYKMIQLLSKVKKDSEGL